jgi:hypothetical protein
MLKQWGEHSAHPTPFSQMGPPSIYIGVRRAGGGFLVAGSPLNRLI